MIPILAISAAFASIKMLLGVVATFYLVDKQLKTRVLFETNPTTVDAQSGLQVISNQCRLTTKACKDTKAICVGTKVTIKKKSYSIKSVFLDESRRVVVCDLAKTKD